MLLVQIVTTEALGMCVGRVVVCGSLVMVCSKTHSDFLASGLSFLGIGLQMPRADAYKILGSAGFILKFL